MSHDFGGYATKAGLKCSDGLTIMPEAFKEMDGQKVPLVWQHGHGDSKNVLGHAVLEAREDGVYAYGYFNDTPSGQNAKALIEHDDINKLSIYANKLVKKAKSVYHGVIREVSLVMAGANPGATIDFVAVRHSDGSVEEFDDEAIITTGLDITHGEPASDRLEIAEFAHADDGETVKDVYDSLTKEQKDVVHYMIGAALESSSAVKQSEDLQEGGLEHEEGTQEMNVFEDKKKDVGEETESLVLSHSDVQGIMADAMKGGSLQEAVENYALAHGIDNIDLLFPDARNLDGPPEWVSRRMEWVTTVLNGVRKTPFSRIKTRSADITLDDARAKGYVKGTMKKEEFFGVLQRTTTPTTVYKKQKLDRDDILDITEFDVVSWMKAEMRVMLDEEIARAILIGDGRDIADEDKVKDPMGAPEGAGIRSIANDHELYVTTVTVDVSGADPWEAVTEDVLRSQRFYKGSGAPTFFSTYQTVVEMLLSKDQQGRRIWKDRTELAAALGVRSIVEVEVMEDAFENLDLLGIIVNLSDYVVGTDRGGQVAMFDDFDIDFNQYKYLIEGRMSGALTKVKSAIVLRKTEAGGETLVVPEEPAYDGTPGSTVVTIPTQTGVDFFQDGQPVADATDITVDEGDTVRITAAPATGYYFTTTGEASWSYRGR